MKILKTIILLLFVTFYSFAQSPTISGVIVDGDNNAVEFANVLLLNSSDSSLVKGQVTNQYGAFEFSGVSKGAYILNSSFIGAGNIFTEVFEVESMDIDLQTLKLVNGVNLDEISIVAKKPFVELNADKMIVNVANSAVASGNSALEVLAKSPGIVLDNNQNIALRGKEGVMVMINGKQQFLTGEALARFLDNMPASSIEKIEIINNPSAKYEAEGNSGIVNIVLKRNENLGISGALSSTLRQGRATSHFHNLNLNYRSEKVNVYGSAEYFDWGRKKDLFLERNIPFEGQFTRFDQHSLTQSSGSGYTVNAGLDYYISPKTSLSFLVKSSDELEEELGDNETVIQGANKPVFDKLVVASVGDADFNNSTFNSNFTHRFNEAGYELSIDADYNTYHNDRVFNYDNSFLNVADEPVADAFYLRNDQLVDIDIFATKVDVTLPVHKDLKVDLGSKYSQVNTMNSTVFEFQDEEGNWINQDNRTNDFEYSENVLAFYLNSVGKIGSFNIQAGLRAEKTFSTGESMTFGKPVDRSYLDFFPSLSVSKSFNEKHNFSFSYSRRLERPNYKDLNPFEFFLDQYTFSRGNPFLNPQYSNTFGLNYALGNALFVAVDYTKTSDVIFEVIEQVNEENKTFQTTQNLDDSESFSVTLSKPVVWSEWFTSRFNYTTYYSSFSSEIPSGTFVNRNTAHFANVNSEIRLPNDYNLEVGMEYQSAVVWGLFDVAARGGIDIAVSKKFFNDRASMKLGIDDLLNTRNSRVSIMQNDIDLIVDQFNDNRRVKATFSYNFGNNKMKAAKKRQTASSAEGNRI